MKSSKYIRWVLGSVLLIAGVLKIVAPENLIEVLFFFGLTNEIMVYSFVYGISIIELVLALALFLNKNPKVVSTTVTFFSAIFLLISVLGYTNDWQLACGCLGEFTYGNFDLIMVGRNLVLLGLSVGLVIDSFRKNTPVRGSIKTNRGESIYK